MTNSLKKKIILAFVVVTIISSTLFFSLSYYELKTSIEDGMIDNANSISEQIKTSMSGYSTEEVSVIKDIISKYKDSKTLSYVSVINANHRIVAHTDNQLTGSDSKEGRIDDVIKSSNTISYVSKNSKGERTLNCLMPLTKDSATVGVIAVGIPMTAMDSTIKQATLKIVVLTVIIVILSVIFAVYLSNGLVKPLKGLMKTLEEVSKGDFTAKLEVNTKDEIGKLASIMTSAIDILRNMIIGIKDTTYKLNSVSEGLALSSEQLAASSQEIACSTQETAQGASDQVLDLNKTFELLQDFENTLNNMEEKLKSVSNGSEKIKDSAGNGSNKIEELSVSVKDVSDTFKYVEERIDALNVSVKKITSITDVINDVAEQTNLLALNAAIEAARAGEVGRGFAVVSDEIRKLAEQVLQSSKDIADTVTEITMETQAVSDSSNSVSHKIQVQMESLEETVVSFKGILNEVEDIIPAIEMSYKALEGTMTSKNEVIEKIKRVNDISKEVSTSSQTIASTVEQQAATMEEFTNTAQELENISKDLQESVARFKL